MINRNLLRGFALMALALGFGLPSLSYSLGTLGRAGPGMFPFIVSCMLFVIGVITVVRARLVAPVPMDFQVRNIAIILGAVPGNAVHMPGGQFKAPTLSLSGDKSVEYFRNIFAG